MLCGQKLVMVEILLHARWGQGMNASIHVVGLKLQDLSVHEAEIMVFHYFLSITICEHGLTDVKTPESNKLSWLKTREAKRYTVDKAIVPLV
jgi:hypothetical protein